MSYLEEHLNPGETIVFRTKTHIVAALPSMIFSGLAALAALFALTNSGLSLITLLLFVVAGLIFLAGYLPYRTNEFGVTTQRVVIKTGWLSVRSLELQLNKVEAIAVDQTWFGKSNGYGTLIVSGSGGTKEGFPYIANPFEFRKAVQSEAEKQGQRARGQHEVPTSDPRKVVNQDPTARQERDCPSCAEAILVAARVCKHCGREVPAMA